MASPAEAIVARDTVPVPRPYPERTRPLPSHHSEIDAAWLTEALNYRYPGVAVEQMTVRKLIDSHSTKLLVDVRLNEAGQRAGVPSALCLKGNWSGQWDNVNIHAVEARFYHFLKPHMKCATPDRYYADWDDTGKGQGVVVLENLTARGGEFGHSTQANGIDRIARSLEDLATLHGSLWGSPLLDQMSWLATSMDTVIDNDQIRIMYPYIEQNLADPEVRKVVPAALVSDPDRLQRAFDRLAQWELAQKTPRCVNLGDCHLGNTYLKPDGERIWLDWQLVRKGRPWRDLTYFMIGSLTVEERRTSDRDLLAHYRQALIGTGADQVPDLDGIIDQYRRWVVYGMQAWIANMDYWGQTGLPMMERFFQAGEDLGTWGLLGE